MSKLTDTQLIILSAAGQRDDGTVLPLPKSLKLQGGAASHVLKSLLKKGLLDEQPAGNNAAAWREDPLRRRVGHADADCRNDKRSVVRLLYRNKRLVGGGRSHQRTILHMRFPVIQGKYREFSRFRALSALIRRSNHP
jgi:hypothetical protein